MVKAGATRRKPDMKENAIEDLPKIRPPRPWDRYGKLMEPGYAGYLDDNELATLQDALLKDKELALWWGWRPSLKRRTEAAIRAVAMYGDPDSRSRNAQLVRQKPGLEGANQIGQKE